jgi:light-regulated signal transduction histidine kinase (bacteriophytochrome)
MAIENLKDKIEAAEAEVIYDELPEINADGQQFTQVLQNLIDNAIKFHGDKKPKIHVGFQKLDDCWQFYVRDNGIGIDKQYHERIFKIFQRLHTQDKYPGYGVGLTICKKIVERHGGKIWVESEKGKGATFYFTIPA